MNKILIDVEIHKSIPGISATSADGSELEVVTAGKMILPIPIHEKNNLVYKMLEENCDLFFHTKEQIDGFTYYPVPMIAIFAFDRNGNQFGTIGGVGGVGDDNFAVGFINQDGKHGKITNNFRGFLELVNYYPNWRKIIDSEIDGSVNDLSELIQSSTTIDAKYLTTQNELANILKIVRNPQIIDQLISNLRGEAEFILYQSIDDAKKANEFLPNLELLGNSLKSNLY